MARIVRREDGRVGVPHGDLRHFGPFGAVAVAAAAADDDQFLRRGADLLDGADHVFESVGRVGVIDDGRDAVCAPDQFEAAADRVQHARRAQRFAAVEAQQDGRAVYGQQVVGVEAAHQPDPYLLSVDAQQHAVRVHLDDLAAEVGHRAQRVGVYGRGGVLHHHAAVFVVGVGQREGLF